MEPGIHTHLTQFDPRVSNEFSISWRKNERQIDRDFGGEKTIGDTWDQETYSR